jgi:hypothetical protein
MISTGQLYHFKERSKIINAHNRRTFGRLPQAWAELCPSGMQGMGLCFVERKKIFRNSLWHMILQGRCRPGPPVISLCFLFENAVQFTF